MPFFRELEPYNKREEIAGDYNWFCGGEAITVSNWVPLWRQIRQQRKILIEFAQGDPERLDYPRLPEAISADELENKSYVFIGTDNTHWTTFYNQPSSYHPGCQRDDPPAGFYQVCQQNIVTCIHFPNLLSLCLLEPLPSLGIF